MPRAFRLAGGAVLIGIAVVILARPAGTSSTNPATTLAVPTITTGPSRLDDADREFLKELAALTRIEFDSLSEEERQSLLLKVSSVSARLPEVEYVESLIGSGEVLIRGNLRGPDMFHDASGIAGVVKMNSGEIVVRLENFVVQNAPILRVILSADPEGNPRGRSIELGILQGNRGSQSFRLPARTSITGMQTLAVYFPPFDTLYAVADLR